MANLFGSSQSFPKQISDDSIPYPLTTKVEDSGLQKSGKYQTVSSKLVLQSANIAVTQPNSKHTLFMYVESPMKDPPSQ